MEPRCPYRTAAITLSVSRSTIASPYTWLVTLCYLYLFVPTAPYTTKHGLVFTKPWLNRSRYAVRSTQPTPILAEP